MGSNERKAVLLGIPFGTANGKLKKIILFEFAEKLNLRNCFRCTKYIDSIEDFSIEHKKSWEHSSTPKETFYDINNIAFSHLHCNIRAGNNPNKKYATPLEKHRAGNKRRYENPITYQNHLKVKREWYAKNNERLSQMVEETTSKVVQ